jgi:DNA-binding CsgD family transcriptional regulator
MLDRVGSVSVVVGRLEPVLARGVGRLLREDGGVRVVADGVEAAALERVVAQRAPRVLIVDERVQHGPIARLQRAHPALGVLVLARSPSPLLRSALRALGIGCVEVAGPADRVLAAVHDAQRAGARAGAAGARQRARAEHYARVHGNPRGAPTTRHAHDRADTPGAKNGAQAARQARGDGDAPDVPAARLATQGNGGAPGAAAERYVPGAGALSAREGEVLAHLRVGRTVKEIALVLGISSHTVWTHTANIRRKLGARSKRDLIEMGERLG